MLNRATQGTKPIKRITSAVKPSAKPSARPSARPSAAKPSARTREHDEIERGNTTAMSSYKTYQVHLHKVSEEIQVIWFTVFDSESTPATIQVSWKSCWSTLECMLKAVYLDVLQNKIVALSTESKERMYDVIEALKAKLCYHHTHSVLQNQSAQLLYCFTDLMEKTGDMSTWRTILQDLLHDVPPIYCTNEEAYRNAQADLIEHHLYRTHRRLKEIASQAQQIAVAPHS